MSKKKTPEDRWRGKFKQNIELGTLKKHEFDKLSAVDRGKYLRQELLKKYPNDISKFYGKYSCETCAILDIFELDGYISETD